MLLERIESEGLAHYSYMIGTGREAVVIDPRRDIQVYLDIAKENELQITHILETHRNEDYLIGSKEIADHTEAQILHSDYENYDFEYGSTVKDGDIVNLGNQKIEAIHTPGHTLGHMSYLLYDDEDNPWIIFTGDTLFAGDVGRTDFYEGQNKEMTGKLYDSIFDKIIPLGDGVIICPSHGAGSVCGSNITERIWTTIGLEKEHNPSLGLTDKSDFIEAHSEDQEYPPYFTQMEKHNRLGPKLTGGLPDCPPLSAEKVYKMKDKAQIIDIRSESCFGGAHIPGSISMAKNIVPNFAGWFLNYEDPIILIGDPDNIETAVQYLFRQGFDNIAGYLKDGITSYSKAGYNTNQIDTINPSALKQSSQDPYILDIRGEEEAEEQPIAHDIRINLFRLPEKMDKLPQDETIYIFCGSGIRSMTAASLLAQAGYVDIAVVLGGTAGWSKM